MDLCILSPSPALSPAVTSVCVCFLNSLGMIYICEQRKYMVLFSFTSLASFSPHFVLPSVHTFFNWCLVFYHICLCATFYLGMWVFLLKCRLPGSQVHPHFLCNDVVWPGSRGRFIYARAGEPALLLSLAPWEVDHVTPVEVMSLRTN